MGMWKQKELALDLGADVLGSVLMGIGIYSFAEQADIAPGGLSGAFLRDYFQDSGATAITISPPPVR